MIIGARMHNQYRIDLCKRYDSIRSQYREAIRKRRVNKDGDINEHLSNMFALAALPRNSSRVRVRNRCAVTGRARGVYRFFGLCRHEIRRLAAAGRLPGVRQMSW